MNYRDYINSKANDYKQHLLNDLKTNIELANIVNSVFFPEKLNIQRWLEETEVKSFYEYDFKGDPFFKRICTKGEIDNIPSLDKISNILSKYTIFSFVKSDNYEEAVENTQRFYQHAGLCNIERKNAERIVIYPDKIGSKKISRSSITT